MQDHNSHSLPNYQIGTESDFSLFMDWTDQVTHGIKSGIQALDKEVRGLQGIVGVVGGPKACKSTLVLQIALHNAMQGNPILFVDRENSRSLMYQRLMCNLYGYSWDQFKKLPREKRIESFTNLQKYPFQLMTTPFTMTSLEAQVDAMMSSVPAKGHAVLVLDSLHKLPMQLDNMRMSVDSWLLFLDHLKQKYNRKLVTLVTCEKRRGAYDEAVKDAAKESGRIEYTLEQQIDLRINQEDKSIIMECTYNRHGPSGFYVVCEPLYGSPDDEWSFLFRLREKKVLSL